MFKDLKQGADKALEVFLIKVRRHFLLATRKNMELFQQAVVGLNNAAVQRAVVGYMDVDQSPQWDNLRRKIIDARNKEMRCVEL